MDERELRQALHTAFDRLRPSPGAIDRAFDSLPYSQQESGPGLRLATVAAVLVGVIAVTALLASRLAHDGAHSAPPVPAANTALPPAPPPPTNTAIVNPPEQRGLAVLNSQVAVVAGWSGTGAVDLTTNGGLTWVNLITVQSIDDIQWLDTDTVAVATPNGLFEYHLAKKVSTFVNNRGDLARLDLTTRPGASDFAVTNTGEVVMSNDAGTTWTTSYVGLKAVSWIQWATLTHAWAAGPDGITATFDSGLSWRTQLTFPPDVAATIRSAQVGFSDESNGFAIFELNGTAGRTGAVVYHTSDSGATWLAEGCGCDYSDVPSALRQGAGVAPLAGSRSHMVVTGPNSAAIIVNSAVAPALCTTMNAGRDWACRAVPGLYAATSISVERSGATWWVVAQTGSGAQIVVSQDAGNTWGPVRRLKPGA